MTLTVEQAIERARSAPCDSAAEMSRAGFRNAAFVLADEVERLKWIQDWLARQLSNRTGRSMWNHVIEANEAYGRLAKLPGKDGDGN